MNKRLLTILLLAFVIAGACAFLVYKAVGNRLGGGTPSSTRIVAAAADLKIGTLLTAQNLTTIDIAGSVPKGAILDPKNAIGRGVVADIYQGEPILDSRLASLGSGGGLAATIPAGMRAMAVKVDDVVGVAGFATPGMHVDVLCSVPIRFIANQAASQQDNTVVKTILQNIEVLSAGVSIQKDPEGKAQNVQVVNLLVTPDQAQTLSLASTGANGTKIQLVLRNPLDTETRDVKENSVGTIFSGSSFGAPVAPPAPRKAKTSTTPPPTGHTSIEVINGSKRTEEKFTTPEAKQ